jgi:hypothetical protein
MLVIYPFFFPLLIFLFLYSKRALISRKSQLERLKSLTTNEDLNFNIGLGNELVLSMEEVYEKMKNKVWYFDIIDFAARIFLTSISFILITDFHAKSVVSLGHYCNRPMAFPL